MVTRRKKPASRIEPAHGILYEPSSLPAVASLPDVDELLDKIAAALKNPFNERQRKAFRAAFTERVSLVWGPPGTGKTTVLAGAMLGWIVKASEYRSPVRIGVGASNYNALDNVLSEIVDLYERLKQHAGDFQIPVTFARVRGDHSQLPQDERLIDVPRNSEEGKNLAAALDSPSTSLVVGGTWMQLGRLSENYSENHLPASRWFDLLIIDEASQMDTASAGAYFLLLTENANVVLAGDHKQLGPIYGFEMHETGEGLLDCIFSYMQQAHGIEPTALAENYRNNEEIACYPRVRFYPQGLLAKNPTRRLEINIPESNGTPPPDWDSHLPWSKEYLRILDPNQPVVVITYGAGSYTLSNAFEAQTVAALVGLYRQLLMQQDGEIDEDDFWDQKLGIVTPHRAQIASIRNNLVNKAGFPMTPPPIVDTVDRFQGLERDLIIASYTVADPDFVGSEEEFILNPRRFNVTLTRARSKFIMFVSDAILQHLPADKDVAEDAAHLQLFAADYCSIAQKIELPFIEEDGTRISVPCQLRVPPLDRREDA